MNTKTRTLSVAKSVRELFSTRPGYWPRLPPIDISQCPDPDLRYQKHEGVFVARDRRIGNKESQTSRMGSSRAGLSGIVLGSRESRKSRMCSPRPWRGKTCKQFPESAERETRITQSTRRLTMTGVESVPPNFRGALRAHWDNLRR